MRVFVLLEWTAVLTLAWLVANILRYLFFKKGGRAGLFFALSETWIRNEFKRKGNS